MLDKQVIVLLIPILALSIPVLAIIASTVVKIARLKAQSQATLSPEVEHRIAVLEEDVGSLRQELSETQERLDFTERLLAQKGDEQKQLRG